MTIFVSVASYRDEDLTKTVSSLFIAADHPENLRFGIVNQQAKGKFDDFSWLTDQAKVKNIPYQDAKGAGYARKLAMELYDGEDFFLQIDSHMRFAKGWDTRLIDMYDWCVNDAGTDRIILSQFAAPFIIYTDGSEFAPKGDPDFWDEPSWTSVVNTWAATWAGNRERITDFSHPVKTHTVLGAWLFSHGNFVRHIPYDERISFMGEELCIAVRAYTRDYALYAPRGKSVPRFGGTIFPTVDRGRLLRWNLSRYRRESF
jgi:glycosyltransferase involved in cell wall biosynthesis